MLGEKQRAIREFFGEEQQILKACEEMDELRLDFDNFLNHQDINTLKSTLIELYDLLNVLEGLYIGFGGELDKISIEKEYKLDRAISIINKINPWENDKMAAYNKIRYEECQ